MLLVKNFKKEKIMTIELKNLRKEKPKIDLITDIKVDRSSYLGNPFKKGSRDEICDQYESYLVKQMSLSQNDFNYEMDRLMTLYKRLGKLTLFCWCVPLRCHSESIKNYILSNT